MLAPALLRTRSVTYHLQLIRITNRHASGNL